MRKTTTLHLLSLFFVAAIVIQACSKDDDKTDEPENSNEFIANDDTFANFQTWPLKATLKGADPAVGNLHGGNDSTVTRNIYIKDDVVRENGLFPQGTVIVKHSFNTAGSLNEYTGMVKRGGNFNSNNNGWEYFSLNADGSIATAAGVELRGSDLLTCDDCHAGAKSTDYVYDL